jgi:hypothetical protein
MRNNGAQRKKILSSDSRTGTSREQSVSPASFLQQILGPLELAEAVFPAEEEQFERERLIAEILAAQCKGKTEWKQSNNY